MLVERDLALQGVHLGGGDGVADGFPGHGLVGGRHALHGVQDHDGAVVGRDGVVVGLRLEPLDVARDPGGHLRVVQHVRGGDGCIPALGGREAHGGQHLRPVHAVPAGLNHARHDLVGLLCQLHAGLQHAAVIQRAGVQRLDAGQDGGVVGRLGVQPVPADHGHAALPGLTLERIGQAHAIGAAVVEDEDRLSLEGIEHVVGHVRSLERIGRDGAEEDRLAGGLVLPGELRVRDVRVGRRWGDDRKPGLTEDGRHRLASAAHLRADGGNNGLVGRHLAGVDRGLRRVVLAGRCRAVVQQDQVHLPAVGASGGVGLLERHHRAVLHAVGGLRVAAGEGQVQADPHRLVGCQAGPKPGGERRRPCKHSGRRATCDHVRVLLVACVRTLARTRPLHAT